MLLAINMLQNGHKPKNGCRTAWANCIKLHYLVQFEIPAQERRARSDAPYRSRTLPFLYLFFTEFRFCEGKGLNGGCPFHLLSRRPRVSGIITWHCPSPKDSDGGVTLPLGYQRTEFM
jgi:hypothetical protein